MNKSEIFEKELNYIKNNDIKNEIEEILNHLPCYFFKIPASSSGKYHPQYALGEGGLVRHTKAAVGIAVELFNNHTVQNFTDFEKDCIIGALILHDGLKGKDYTEFKHPLKMKTFCETFLKPSHKIIANAIASHMGEWSTSKYEEGHLPKPQTELEKFVHLCDYLASRKCLEFNFEV